MFDFERNYFSGSLARRSFSYIRTHFQKFVYIVNNLNLYTYYEFSLYFTNIDLRLDIRIISVSFFKRKKKNSF